jgi:prepilin-type processing-associated H-X9-DG protein
MILLFANNAESSIAAPINAATTTVQLVAGDGQKFPNPVVGSQFFKLTFVDAATGLVNEIVNVTQRVGDVLTIVRAQEGTRALPWLAGDAAKNLTTAQTQSNFIQIEQAQENATNYARDTGGVNAYVIALTPAVTTRKEGLYARIKALTTNTGPSTLNLGAGSFPILNPDLSDLGANAIIGGGIFEVVDDGGPGYQLISASQEAQSGAGLSTTGAFQWRPTAESLPGWIVANQLTVGDVGSGAGQLASPTAANIFAWLWRNFPNNVCPIYNSAGQPVARGANPAADFAALKQIASFDMRGISPIGADTMGNQATGRLNGVPVVFGDGHVAGSLIGENLHTLVLGELANHSHGNSLNDPGHVHSYLQSNVDNSGSGGGSAGLVNAHGQTANTGLSGTGMSINNGGVNGLGGTAAHNNVALSATGYWYIKL